MKRIIISVLILSMLITVTGCTGNADTKVNGAITDKGIVQKEVQEAAVTPTKWINYSNSLLPVSATTDQAVIESDVDYKELSKQLALQMTERDFTKLYDTFTFAVKLQVPQATFQQTWDATVLSLGKFVKVYEVTEETTDKNHIVDVILQYENNGLRIKITYNTSGKIEGLRLNYTPIKTELVSNSKFTETEIAIGDGKEPLYGILTLPKGVKKPPVVILVHGSGTHDMDESIGPNKPFQDIAHGLAKQGIASIRYHERMLQYPNTKITKLTIQNDSLDDANQVIDYAAACNKVDKNKIYVIGHSLGGMVAPKLAKDNKEVAGIVFLAGSPRKLEDISLDQNKFFIEKSGDYTKEQKELMLVSIQKEADKIKKLERSDTAVLLGIPASFWYSLNQIKTPEIVKSLKIPILIAQGSADWQVYPDKDYAEWKKLLKGKKNVTFHLYDNLNHLFMKSNGITDVTEYNIKGTVEQKVIDDIAVWIKGKKK